VKELNETWDKLQKKYDDRMKWVIFLQRITRYKILQ
jgi:hypothetical protein